MRIPYFFLFIILPFNLFLIPVTIIIPDANAIKGRYIDLSPGGDFYDNFFQKCSRKDSIFYFDWDQPYGGLTFEERILAGYSLAQKICEFSSNKESICVIASHFGYEVLCFAYFFLSLSDLNLHKNSDFRLSYLRQNYGNSIFFHSPKNCVYTEFLEEIKNFQEISSNFGQQLSDSFFRFLSVCGKEEILVDYIYKILKNYKQSHGNSFICIKSLFNELIIIDRPNNYISIDLSDSVFRHIFNICLFNLQDSFFDIKSNSIINIKVDLSGLDIRYDMRRINEIFALYIVPYISLFRPLYEIKFGSDMRFFLNYYGISSVVEI